MKIKFFENKKIMAVFAGASLLMSLIQSHFFIAAGAVEKSLVLTGDLYSFVNSESAEYTFQIDSVEKLRSLEGKQLGFKIKQVTVDKNGKSEIQEEVTEILGARVDTEKESSLEIYRSIQKMLGASSDGKTLVFRLIGGQAEEGFSHLQSLLEGKYKHKRESILVEYFDNRVNGDSTTTVKVLYKFGKKGSSSSGSGFVMDTVSQSLVPSGKKETDVKSQSGADQANILSSMEVAQILSVLKDQSSVLVKLNESQENIVPKSLLSGLMYDKYKNKELIFEKYNNNILVYRWTVPVENIHDTKNFDMGISMKNTAVDEIVRDRFSNYRVVSFGMQEVLPATCKVEILVDLAGLDSSNLQIFSVDLEKKTIERKSVNYEIKDNMISMTVGFGGNYIIAS